MTDELADAVDNARYWGARAEKAEAEVERLRAESETRRGIIEREAVIVSDLSAEVERLRQENQNDFLVKREAHVVKLNARVGWLWQRLTDMRVERNEALDEVERLRRQNEQLTSSDLALIAANEEVERLRAELHDAETLIEDLRDGVKLNEEYRQEVERLRAALERIEEDPMLGVIPLKNIARAALAEEDNDVQSG